MEEKSSPKYRVKTLEKGLNILNLFVNKNKLSFTQIKEKLNMNNSTLYRLLYILEYYNYIIKDEKGFYELGIKAFSLGNSYREKNNLIKYCKPELIKLSNSTELTAHLGHLEKDKIFYIDKISSDDISMYSRIGTEVPFHCSALGKAILSFQPEEKRQEILEKENLDQRTSNTITEEEELISHLELIKERGYSIDDYELQNHIKCYAAPILNRKGIARAAISLTGVPFQIEKINENSVIDRLKSSASKIEEEIYG